MKLQDQVCTLEQARRLKELGINAFGLFVHYTNKALPADFGIKPKEQTASWAAIGEIKDGGVINYYPAFTVAELGVMLPEFNLTYKGLNNTYACFDMRGEMNEKKACEWHINFHLDRGDFCNEKTEAQVRAAMLIHLLENKLTTATEVNNRLNPQQQ